MTSIIPSVVLVVLGNTERNVETATIGATETFAVISGMSLFGRNEKYSGQSNVIARRLANVRCVLKEVVAGTDSDRRLSA